MLPIEQRPKSAAFGIVRLINNAKKLKRKASPFKRYKMYNSPKKGPKTTNNFYNPKTTCIKIGSFLQETKEKHQTKSSDASLVEGSFH